MIKKSNYVYVKDDLHSNIEQGSILNITTNSVTTHTHGFHKYPAKFIPQIPRWAINKYLNKKKEQTVLDPFCGSGTTLVEGLLSEQNVIGVDIDPLSVLISKVKTTTVDVVHLNRISEWLVKAIKAKKKGNFTPECETIEHWFTKEAINKLSVIRSLINKVPEKFGTSKKTEDIRDLLLICFSSILRRSSKADNESQKTYVSHTKIKNPEEPLNLFLRQLDLFKKRIKDFSESVSPRLKNKIICSSNTDYLKENLKDQHIDLVITSPPYIKAIDYIYNQMVELFWIGDLFDMQTQPKQNNKKKGYIGTKQIKKNEFVEYTPFNTTLGIKKIDDKIKEVFTKDEKNGHKHAYITFKYFRDMEKHFKEMEKCLSKGSHYIMVVGNCSVSNVFFETVDMINLISKRNGFHLTNKWGYLIKNRYMRFDRKGRGGIIKIDWVLDLVRK